MEEGCGMGVEVRESGPKKDPHIRVQFDREQQYNVIEHTSVQMCAPVPNALSVVGATHPK